VGIAVLFRSNAEGRTYGITFVDNNSKTVFNGSALGKEYSAAPILERLSSKGDTITQHREPDNGSGRQEKADVNIQHEPKKEEISTVIKDLVTSDTFDPRSPEAALRLGKKRRKRKSRRL
jgi:hypothetical protein